jgi:hypothetical protein
MMILTKASELLSSEDIPWVFTCGDILHPSVHIRLLLLVLARFIQILANLKKGTTLIRICIILSI